MDNNKGWVLVFGILALIALTAFSLVWLIYTSIQRTVEPVQSMTGDISTQVANILHPTPTILPDPITIVRDVRSLARLETIQYTIEKVIRAGQGEGPLGMLFGDQLIFVAHGQVLAGVDLAKLKPEDLVVKDGVLYVDLPAAEVFVSALDNEKSYVYDRDTGIFTKGDINLEAAARRAAEHEIEKAALEDGVLNLANQNAEHFLERLFNDLGYPTVIFTGSDPTPQPTP